MNAENKPQLTVPLSVDSFSCPKCQTIQENGSPYDDRCRITLKDINRSTRLVFHLWRNKPQSVAAPPDLVYEMSFVP